MPDCKEGKIKNPLTGYCISKNSLIFQKRPKNIIMKCPGGYINPKTKRCIQLSNIQIKKLLQRGYILEPEIPPKKKQYIIPSKKINDVKNIKNPTVIVPPDINNIVKLVYCGPNMVINPVTKRCIKLSGSLGKKLTSVPYTIVNPPNPRQKTPLFIPNEPKPQKGKYEQKPYPKIKPEKIKTALDTDENGYISIKEYLDSVKSLGPNEKAGGKDFSFYNQRDLGILFILSLIKNQKGPIHHIACVPLYYLCVYKNKDNIYYTLKNLDSLKCPINNDLAPGMHRSGFAANRRYDTYASIAIINVPRRDEEYYNINKTQILLPPHLKELINKCENDNKYMVVCDLTLLESGNFDDPSHSNILIFDTKRKTIERFDPHGGNEYIKANLVYDNNSIVNNRKDFKFGKVDTKKYYSNALYDQVFIDTMLKNRFKIDLPNYTYYGTSETCPYLGPQVKADDYGGLCVTWTCMYVILRLLNPDLTPADVTIRMIDGKPTELKDRILRFQKFIIRTLKKEKAYLKE